MQALVVRMVREELPKAITLAIGDGELLQRCCGGNLLNETTMPLLPCRCQRCVDDPGGPCWHWYNSPCMCTPLCPLARVYVVIAFPVAGISGMEGQQASNSADYAIGVF